MQFPLCVRAAAGCVLLLADSVAMHLWCAFCCWLTLACCCWLTLLLLRCICAVLACCCWLTLACCCWLTRASVVAIAVMLGVLATFAGQNATRAAPTRQHQLRLFSAGLSTSAQAQGELQHVLQPWSLPTAATVGAGNFSTFSAVAYYFGVALWVSHGIPIGLVAADWGGTSVEAWSPAAALDECGLPHTPHPAPDQRNSPSGLFNAMIHPLLQLTITGSIWYQGEHDSLPVNHSRTYACSFPALVRSWRDGWGGGTPHTFPFGFVQLSDVNDASNETCGDGKRCHPNGLSRLSASS
eukprot:SAG11_NODE_1873_length_4150_cov_1.815354_3_plen_297_part_00